jgi:hypothetical protein
MPACRNSGSVAPRGLRISGPIRPRLISQRRPPGSHRPPAARINGSRSCAADHHHGAQGAELGRGDAGWEALLPVHWICCGSAGGGTGSSPFCFRKSYRPAANACAPETSMTRRPATTRFCTAGVVESSNRNEVRVIVTTPGAVAKTSGANRSPALDEALRTGSRGHPAARRAVLQVHGSDSHT